VETNLARVQNQDALPLASRVERSVRRSPSPRSSRKKDPAGRSRYLLRWLRRLLEEDECLTIDEAALAVSALAGLGGRGHAEALSALSTRPNVRLGNGLRGG
jgi:hypothetical protein